MRDQQPPKRPRPVPAPRVYSQLFGQLAQDLEAGGEEKNRAIAQLEQILAQDTPHYQALSPEEGVVTFLFDAEDQDYEQVLLFANRLTDESRLEDTLLEPLKGSRFWWASFRMPSNWRASYCFIPARPGQVPAWVSSQNQVQLRAALDRGQADAHNPRHCPNRLGRLLSLLELPAAPVSPYSCDYRQATSPSWQPGPRGQKLALESIGPAQAGSPLVLVFDGEVWAAQGLVTAARRAYQAGALAPLHLLLLDSGGRERRWQDLGGESTPDQALEEALTWARRQGLEPTATSTCLLGQSLGGLSAIGSLLARPDLFGRAISQSASLWHPRAQKIFQDLSSPQQKRDWGEKYDSLDIICEVGQQEWILLEPHQLLADRAQARGLKLQLHSYQGGHDYACWRVSLIDHLITFFPAQP